MKAKNLLAIVSVLILSLVCRPVHAQGTAFTYQGQLVSSGVNANGNYDFQFGLYTNVSTGSLIGSLETNTAVGVSNGVFTTTLNFSNVFNGSNYWLGIGVRSGGTTNAFTVLSPRQAITPTPYAITASNLTGTLPATQLSGTLPGSNLFGNYSNSVSFTNTTNVFVGNGSGLTGVPGVTSSNFLYAYDYTDQEVTTGGFQNIAFGTTSSVGWLVPTSGEFVAQTTGVYLVQYHAHVINNSASSSVNAIIRGILNITTSPTEIYGSEAVLTIYPQFVGQLSGSFLIQMTAGQMLTLQVGASAAATAYIYSYTVAGQSFAGASLSIVRIE